MYLAAGNFILWLRYGEWLLTCPVIVSGLEGRAGRGEGRAQWHGVRLRLGRVSRTLWPVPVTAAPTLGEQRLPVQRPLNPCALHLRS